jgi:hypothetical protein
LLSSPLGEEHSPSFQKLESPPQIIFAKSGLNWPSGSSGEEVENVKVYRWTYG